MKEIDITNAQRELKQATETMQNASLSKKANELFFKGINSILADNASVLDDEYFFLATGDIPAMWLRDSTFQMLPLVKFADHLPAVKKLIHALITTQCHLIQIDPYANSFRKDALKVHTSDVSNVPISPKVWERKYELDSLCAPIFIAYKLYEQTGDTEQFDQNFWETVKLILAVFKQEQHHNDSPYTFERSNGAPTDTLTNEGKGEPVRYTGLIWSGFRPSDDACKYGYLVPANMYAVVILQYLEDLINHGLGDQSLLSTIVEIKDQVIQGIQESALTTVGDYQIFAYEVDGLGNYNLMDDANVPSLLSLPYLGYCSNEDELYVNTRRFILSDQNPYYYKGKFLSGIGSPHTPESYVWPIALSMEGLTSDSVAKQKVVLETIADNDGDTLHVHESIHVDDPKKFTRESFSWADMTYCQLFLNVFENQVK
ncbi:glycosyl hydrolase [Pediococcus damnosus LMG 28219]|nr:glycosyl hydrolase [Pediococcus damnosus LMG 28219]